MSLRASTGIALCTQRQSSRPMPSQPRYSWMVGRCRLTMLKIVTTGRLKDGDLALRFRVRPPVMTANVYAGYPIDIGIDHPICRNLGTTNVLAQIRKEVGPIVAALERKFFGTPSE